MKENKNLIVFGEDWGRFPTSTQNLIAALSKQGWHVIWINSIGLRKPTLSFTYLRRIFDKMLQYIRGKSSKYRVSTPENVVIINPLIIPFIGNSIADRLNCFILKKQLRKAIFLKEFTQPIIWTTLPTAYPLLKIFKSSPLIYYCCDEYSLLGESQHPKIPFFEERLKEDADLILVVSDPLAQKMPQKKTYLLDHAIDVSLFMKSFQRPKDLPCGKPIAGFYGAISNWVDLELIFQCATQLTHWNFVFIGPSTMNLTNLESLNNFFYLGPKAYVDLPAYSQHWDVGLIPFVNDQVSIACNPLKIKEYLATGKPVVSIDIPALHVYKNHIFLAKNTTDFIRSIELSLNDMNNENRKNLVKDQSWDNRAKILEKKILELRRIID